MLEDEDDYWDSPAYNDFWKGAPGLPPHAKTRPNYGSRQVRTPEDLIVGTKYQFEYFNGFKKFSRLLLITGKDEKGFYFEVVSPPEAVEELNKETARYRGKLDFADCSMVSYERTGFWNQDGNCILRITE